MRRLTAISLASAMALTVCLGGCNVSNTNGAAGSMVSKPETSVRPSHAPDGAMVQEPYQTAIPALTSFAAWQRSNAWYHFEMANASEGYRWGYMNGRFAMQRTSNEGGAWSTISLPVTFTTADGTTGSGWSENPNVQIVGPDSIFVYGIQGQTLVACRSADAGQHWIVSKSNLGRTGYQLVSVSQPSRSDAWLWLTRGTGNQGETRFLHLISRSNQATVASMRTGVIDNGKGGVIDGAWTFNNDKQGWMAAISPTGQLYLCQTNDGGSTWTSRLLHAPKPLGALPAVRVYAPVRLGSEGTFVAVFQANRQGAADNRVVVFRSRDGGKTFAGQLVDRLDQAQANVEGAPAVFINPDNGFAVSRDRLLRTTDSGDSWRWEHSNSLETALQKYPCVLGIDFLTEGIGYMLLGSRDHTQSVLFRTDDTGGWVPADHG
ncbi:WD40/YVTN/BNR-like repeat-containing protein [Alicyclobacillus acidiphilus]|uniref:WD40/YVTN/BNR-like repeat-containing protein n=1 Tax=Alicyclobacillus acidiphilus TaxID=182455 RepID=UPI000836A4A8|nr:hypothetical protein [Alicyclobacillus acidiphilus]